MEPLPDLISSYLQTQNFTVTQHGDRIVAQYFDEVIGTFRVLIVWCLPETDDRKMLESYLTQEFREQSHQYPDSELIVVYSTLGGLSKAFTDKARSQYGVHFRAPIQFFDRPFKAEVQTGQVRTVMGTLQKPLDGRIPQPYDILSDGQLIGGGDDLLEDLANDYLYSQEHATPALRIIVGPAGVGKSWLFRQLFSRLYNQFLKMKRAMEDFPRPIPFLPEHHTVGNGLRVTSLIESFISTEMATLVRRETFEWMVVHGFTTWFFDGLDELYSEDPDFFDTLEDLMTRRDSRAQILICARNSLLTSSRGFRELLKEFSSGVDPSIRIYQLKGWEQGAKQVFAGYHFQPPHDRQFLASIARSESLNQLSSLPYYCDLLRQEYQAGRWRDFKTDIDLIGYVTAEILDRERQKGILRDADFEQGGLENWLNTVAYDFYKADFKGVKVQDLEENATVVISSALSTEEYNNAITTLIQFPLFAPGAEPETLVFQHELIAEYLAGAHLLQTLPNDPVRVGRDLGLKQDFGETLICRHIANEIAKDPRLFQSVISALENDPPVGRAFSNLLELLLKSSRNIDLLRKSNIVFEGHDLSQLVFEGRNLSGISFINCDLSDTVFRSCILADCRFEGAILAETRFDNIPDSDLRGTRFGNLQRFESVYVKKTRYEDRFTFAQWVQSITGYYEASLEPCSTAQQLRQLFLKFVDPLGRSKRDKLTRRSLTRGKRHPGAPEPDELVQACITQRYLRDTHFHDQIQRMPGARYDDLISFVTEWKLTTDLERILDSHCTVANCEHIYLA